MVRIVHFSGRKRIPTKQDGRRLYSEIKFKSTLSWAEQRDIELSEKRARLAAEEKG